MREHHRALCEFLRSVGAERVRMGHGGKHARVEFLWRGEERSYTTSDTLGDTARGTKNAISELRHMLDLVATEKRVGERRERRRQTPATVPMPQAHTIQFAEDWRERLRRHPLAEGAR